ncbi:GtrA family protein [Nibricoccus sp. IMCC34717]|uniref:GtrA family protein n=1 Tax=Nibricoccus sp. IMCC34717 TaxID=3034021 RepID=UPI00384EF4A2
MSDNVLQILRFVIVGGTVTCVFMALNHVLHRRLGRNGAFLVAYPPSVALHYLLNKLWTFQDKTPTGGEQLTHYLLLTAVAFVIQWGMYQLLTRFTRLPAWLASGAATAAQMALAFVAMRAWVFAKGA